MIEERLKAFACGIAFGSVMALLYAPKSGSRTRRSIALKAKEGKAFLANQSGELRDQVADVVDRGKDVMRRSVRAAFAR